MKKSIFTFLGIILFVSTVNAQFGMGKFEDINEVKSKTLLVTLDEVSDKLEKKIKKKPEKFQAYKDEIEAYNSALKKAFTDTWTFSANIKFITESELNEIRKDKSKKDKYAFFSNKINRSPSRMMSNMSSAGNPDTYSMFLGLTDQNRAVYEMMYTTLYPTEADLTFIIQQFQNYLIKRLEQKTEKKSRKELMAELNDNAKFLKDRTLLLDENFVEDELKKNIDDFYKYEYKITTKEEIDAAILARDENIAYIRAFPVVQQSGGKNSVVKLSKLLYLQYAIDAKDGTILGYAAPGSMGIGGNIGTLLTKSNRNTSQKDLEKIAENIK